MWMVRSLPIKCSSTCIFAPCKRRAVLLTYIASISDFPPPFDVCMAMSLSLSNKHDRSDVHFLKAQQFCVIVRVGVMENLER
ncbi:hypothetical protein K437DRAFT_27728 [Tilletiaria anomala UBC 951]|uniref:Uncharacterized protein n=1 Tax=Tilletiaria anomala (strain ATCC 24038 / CBS 436.72 / UBC 951) TaxID=1037660 RepID=A0A066VHP5_TILAU|nr:uncharacterized protein K437DRAFT_27728 [Tilletiaria anomala UBC 951]KDN38264.1 hypothetical protein K437DRAFT_27728 [Tilletiaria anomala UBC 951]